jgi:hypothetical protein
MKRTELRIGNLVERNGKIYEVSSIHADDTIRLFNKDKIASIGCFSLKEVNPIPITEEWLFKLGFKKDTKYDWELKVNGVLFYGMCDDSQPVNTGITILNLPNSIINIKHVHQLQNLYFALTGEELIIKN